MKLIYLFDPLCGWCYASSPAAQVLANSPNVELDIYATGLFADSGRKMDAAFAEHAWRNDQRIAELTGQPFNEAYRRQILLGNGEFNSRALSELCVAAKARGNAAMMSLFAAMQKARYVEGLDTSKRSVLQDILQNLSEAELVEKLGSGELKAETDRWIAEGQAIAHHFQSNGVPSLFAETAKGWVNVPSQLLYQQPEKVVENVKTFLERVV